MFVVVFNVKGVFGSWTICYRSVSSVFLFFNLCVVDWHVWQDDWRPLTYVMMSCQISFRMPLPLIEWPYITKGMYIACHRGARKSQSDGHSKRVWRSEAKNVWTTVVLGRDNCRSWNSRPVNISFNLNRLPVHYCISRECAHPSRSS